MKLVGLLVLLAALTAACQPAPCPEGARRTITACQLDQDAATSPCPSPQNYTNVGPGVHTAHVYAVTVECQNGVWVSSPLAQDSRTWTVTP